MKSNSRFFILCGFILFNACKEAKKEVQVPNTKGIKIVKRFAVIEKDSTFYMNEKLDKSFDDNGAVTYKYTNDSAGSFSVVCDTAQGVFKFWANAYGPIKLFVEKEKVFTVNGVNYKVYKLVADKDSMDGEVTFFFNTGLGVFHFRSNTWRTGTLLTPEKDDASYLQLTALIYKVLTDDEFYQKPAPQVNIKKFTVPKLNY